MKKIWLFLVLIFSIVTSTYSENKTVKFSVEPPLVCQNCENKVKTNLRFEKGVKSINPSAKKGEIEVTFDDTKTDIIKLKEGFRKIGYEASLIETEKPISEEGIETETVNCHEE